jgi:hypothetical protein
MVFETSSTHFPPLATTSAIASVLVNSLNLPLKQTIFFLNVLTVEAEAAAEATVATEAEAAAEAEAGAASIPPFYGRVLSKKMFPNKANMHALKRWVPKVADVPVRHRNMHAQLKGVCQMQAATRKALK